MIAKNKMCLKVGAQIATIVVSSSVAATAMLGALNQLPLGQQFAVEMAFLVVTLVAALIAKHVMVDHSSESRPTREGENYSL